MRASLASGARMLGASASLVLAAACTTTSEGLRSRDCDPRCGAGQRCCLGSHQVEGFPSGPDMCGIADPEAGAGYYARKLLLPDGGALYCDEPQL